MANGRFKKKDPRINRAGRPKGAPNTDVESIRHHLALLVTGNWHRLQAAIDGMSDKDAFFAIERLLRHYLPAPQDEIKMLTADDVERIANRLQEKYGT